MTVSPRRARAAIGRFFSLMAATHPHAEPEVFELMQRQLVRVPDKPMQDVLVPTRFAAGWLRAAPRAVAKPDRAHFGWIVSRRARAGRILPAGGATCPI